MGEYHILSPWPTSSRRRRHAKKIAKLKAMQAANNRKILLGGR